MCFDLNCWLFLNIGKRRICYENLIETRIRDMYENAKLCIAMKMAQIYVKNERPPTVLILEKK